MIIIYIVARDVMSEYENIVAGEPVSYWVIKTPWGDILIPKEMIRSICESN